MTVGVIDYGMGNLRSVSNAVDYLGHKVTLIKNPSNIGEFDHIILPGVGSYLKAMENLTKIGFKEVLKSHISRGIPLLGICLGMQLLSSVGYEPTYCQGLNMIEGEVVPFALPQSYAIPHVGWNQLVLKYDHPVFDGIRIDVDFYFVHSYHYKPKEEKDILGLTEYCNPFVSAVAKKNIVGLQFHPEKSQVIGLKLLDNFCNWDGIC